MTDSSTANLVGIQSLRTLARLHAAYFSCSNCQLAFPLSNSTNEEFAIWMADTLAHLAEHWRTASTEDGTDG